MSEERKRAWTPGPWRVEQDTTVIWGACNPDDRSTYGMGYLIAECRITPSSWRGRKPDEDEGEANAHLIAASPELYEALERALMELKLIYMKDCSAVYDTTIRIDASSALAKARGETS